MDYKKNYELWLNDPAISIEDKEALKKINSEEDILDRFYMDLEFGTAGLRGKIGLGTNRMNKYIVARASQGLAEVIKKQGKEALKRGVAIAYDCRHFSEDFSKVASQVLTANGIKVYLFEELRPTPELSYAIRKLKTISGIVVTASHNPKDYNGYKVYWQEGTQILSDIADQILFEINKIKNFSEIKYMDLNEAYKEGLFEYIGKEIDDDYINEVKKLSFRDEEIDKNIKIVYSPLNGTGNIPVRRVLKERGFNNIYVVPEQELPDPNFTTIEYPNPEDIKAFEYAEKLGEKIGAKVLIATDPDCDRLAVMVKEQGKKGYTSINGNQTGALMINYILETLKEKEKLPQNGAIVKSIVTGELGTAIAKKYGVKMFDVLTGFKNICGKAIEFEREKNYEFLFGYEESIGYTIGTLVGDKDGVSAAMLLAEMAGYYNKKGEDFIQVLNQLYEEFGYFKEDLISIVLEGQHGQERISRMMIEYRKNFIKSLDGIKLKKYIDYSEGIQKLIFDEKIEKIDIPKTNAIKFEFDDGTWYSLRPSGTEPKIKLYMYTVDKNEKNAELKLNKLKESVLKELYSIN